MSNTLFVGLGRMGRPMARHIARHFPTTVYDIVPEVVDEVAAEIDARPCYDLGSLSDVKTVILMAPTSAHVEAILLESGMMSRMLRGTLIIDMGSSVPSSTRKIHALAAERGVHFVDAPVSGGISKAETGELAMLVGGDPESVELARPYLDAVGSEVVVVGPSGAGHAAKSINNLVSATNQAVVNEALIRARSAGIEPERMVAVLNSSTGMSQASAVKFPRHVLTEQYDSRFSFDLMLKDINIAMGIETQISSTPLTSALSDLLLKGRPLLGDTPDHTEITRLYERMFNTLITKETP